MSFFSSYGKKETSYTRSLSALFSTNTSLFRKFVRKITNINLSRDELNSIEIHPEITESDSRYDIYCESDSYIIIIEAKIGCNTVSQKQIDKYLNQLINISKQRIIITLTEFEQPDLSSSGGINIFKAYWSNIWEVLGNDKFEIDINSQFKRYMEENLVKTYDIDIWAVRVVGDQLTNFENGFYCNHNKHSPVMIGLREKMDNGKVRVKRLYPVIKIIDRFSTDIQKYIKENDIKMMDGWDVEPPNIYVLGKELVLETPLDKTFNMASYVNVKFSDL